MRWETEMTEETSDADYHERVMTMVGRINASMHEGVDEYSVTVNALITLLAMAGKEATLTQREYCMHVAVQLDHIMSQMSVEPHNIQ